MPKKKVLIVDDSLFYRRLLQELIERGPFFEVVGMAADAQSARSLIKEKKPDVITLDIEMPGMDGLTFLKRLMSVHPLPVVMVSTLTQKGADTTINALELGAIDCVGKPLKQDPVQLKSFERDLTLKLRSAAVAKLQVNKASLKNEEVVFGGQQSGSAVQLKKDLIAIGGSTGGVEAIHYLLQRLGGVTLPPIVIVQHMPPYFTAAFAQRLNKQCPQMVEEISQNKELLCGHVYIAKGDRHLLVSKNSGKLIGKVQQGDKVSGHIPSVDVLFNAVAETIGKKSLGVLLTGMGKDGAMGLKAIYDAKGVTLAQNEASCVIFGMPKAAIDKGCVNYQCDLDEIAKRIVKGCYGL